MVERIETFRARDGRTFGTEEEAVAHERDLADGRIEPGRRIQYSSNNSGGSWWLSEADRKALEAAGWLVEWSEWERGRHSWSWSDSGTPAHYAWAPVGMTEDQACEDFERVTGQSPDAQGCNCCGQPHNFDDHDAAEAAKWARYAGPTGWNKQLEADDDAREKRDGE